MTQRLLVDTDILIDIGRSVEAAIVRLEAEAQRATLAISFITQMELIIGCRNTTELRSLERFFQPFEMIPINEVISDQSVDLLKSYRLSHNLLMSHNLLIPDALIAATAIVHKIPLLTKNQKDYRFIDGLTLLSYP